MRFLFTFLLFQTFFEIHTSLNHKSVVEDNLIVTYNALFKNRKDSPNQITAITRLYITDTTSLFIEEHLENILRMDALDYGHLDKQQIKKAEDGYASMKYFVEKFPNRSYVSFTQEFARGQFFEYGEKMMSSESWTIKEDTATIVGLMSSKAECFYGGRAWVAWFSPEIPISEGPYKFSGLPGLIVKLESLDGDYQFILSGISRLKNQTPKLPARRQIEKSKFKDLRIASYDHRFPENTFVKGTIHGKSYNHQETIQFMKQGELNKNYIELD